jgi:hypothetical protein
VAHELGTRLGRDDFLLVLEPVARADLSDQLSPWINSARSC